jgi:hypothetical protein
MIQYVQDTYQNCEIKYGAPRAFCILLFSLIILPP